MQQSRVKIFSIDGKFHPEPLITTLDQGNSRAGNSRIEALYNGKKSYSFCKSHRGLRGNSWGKLFKELGVKSEEAYFLTPEECKREVLRIFNYDLQGNLSQDSYWAWGHGTSRYSVKGLTKSKKLSEGEIVAEIRDQLTADKALNWRFASHLNLF